MAKKNIAVGSFFGCCIKIAMAIVTLVKGNKK
jgi:hypothetical protein